MSTDRLLTAREVAQLLAVPESWVREATRQNTLPHLRLGRYRRYQQTDIAAWLTTQKHGKQLPNEHSGETLQPAQACTGFVPLAA